MVTKNAIAIVAHPDDIEFLFAGTMLQLAARGWNLHYITIASGNCGSLDMDAEETRQVRQDEAQCAAAYMGAKYYPPLCDDLEIVYSVDLLRRLSSVIRSAAPNIVLTHSPEDYMVDHMETSRLAVTAAFTHGMPNFVTDPPTSHLDGHQTTVYHAMPHGLRDGLRKKIIPESYVDISSVMDSKRVALAEHKSQHSWLESSQGMNSYLMSMENMSRELGEMSGKFDYAEGWRRRSHLGFSQNEEDPLSEALQELYYLNPEYNLDN